MNAVNLNPVTSNEYGSMFSTFSNKPYHYRFDIDTHFEPRLSALENTLFVDSTTAGKSTTRYAATKFCPNLDTFAFSGLDVPFLIEWFNIETKEYGYYFVYYSKHEEIKISEQSHPLHFKQLESLYQLAIENKATLSSAKMLNALSLI